MKAEPNPVLLQKAQVCSRLSLSARTLEGMVKVGDFPPPVRLGKCVYWTETSVDKWLVRMFGAQNAWTPL
jgi:prophage regulatory protein